MKKIVTIFVAVSGLIVATANAQAPVKFAYISQSELITNMPEYKKADSSLLEFNNALNQNFEELKREFSEGDSLLSSKDTVKYTRAQLEIKRKNLGELYLKLQGYQQQASQQYQQKSQELLAPIQKKAQEIIQNVAKENGYSWVFNKEALISYPAAEDLLPLVKKKLGIK
jgi:outer membrane protein